MTITLFNIAVVVFAIQFLPWMEAGRYTLNTTENAADTLAFSVRAFNNNKANKMLGSFIAPKLQHDAKNKYPFYQLKKRWRVGENYQLIFHQLPPSGYLYVFNIDGMNNAQVKEVIELDSLISMDNSYKSLPSSILFPGKEHLCIWFSKSKIDKYEKKIQAIELTHGDFVQRCNTQLGKDLLLPDSSWYFSNKKIQFIKWFSSTDTTMKSVASIILELDISN